MTETKAIGGFYGLELALPEAQPNFLTLWQADAPNALLFHDARSAIHHVLAHNPASDTLWIPAYISPSVVQAAKNTGKTLNFYPIDESLSPVISFLEEQVGENDTVLGLNYYGRLPSPEFLEFVKAHQAITWIEDRVQSMWPSDSAWGDFIFYSPRKQLGVPDGGILIDVAGTLPKPDFTPLTSARFIDASLLRYEDTKEEYNENWYKSYVQHEDAIDVSVHPMSRLTYNILQATNPEPIMQARKENYTHLYEKLEAIALLPKEELTYVPFGFPVDVGNKRDALAAHLAENRIFAPRFWPELPAPKEEFPFEHTLAETTLMLPCDHRYTLDDMEKVAACTKEALRT